MLSKIKNFILHGSIVLLISIGLVIGIIFGIFLPDFSLSLDILGDLFLKALKAAAPVLVFFLIISSLMSHKAGTKTNITQVIILYLGGTLLSAIAAVGASLLFPSMITLSSEGMESLSGPEGMSQMIKNLLFSITDNPLNAIVTGNFIGILAWSVLLGFFLRGAGNETKQVFSSISDALIKTVRLIIRFAPLGIMGLVASAIAQTGLGVLLEYLHLVAVLVGTMLFIALVLNPLLVFWKIRRNPYPLVFTTLKESAITAFFTRSSAANIPVNLTLAKKMGLEEETYSVTIPLGATINMEGAAVTITVLTLAVVNTLGIEVSLISAILLSIVASLASCGTSGVPGGSLLLVPLACGLFSIPADIAMTAVGAGMTISVIQDSMETALNSSTDILFTAAADMAAKRKPAGKDSGIKKTLK